VNSFHRPIDGPNLQIYRRKGRTEEEKIKGEGKEIDGLPAAGPLKFSGI